MVVHSQNARQLAGWITCGLGIAVLAARWPNIGTLAIAFLILLTFAKLCSFLANRKFPVFQLSALLALLGFIACWISLWTLGGPWVEVHRFGGGEANVAMSPDGNFVAASQGTSIEIRETKTGKHLQTLDMPPREAVAKGPGRWTYKLAFSKDSERLLVVGWRDDTYLYDWNTGAVVRSWSGGGMVSDSGVRFTAKSGDSYQDVGVYATDSPEPICIVINPSGMPRCIPSLSPKGRYLANYYHDFVDEKSVGEIVLWDVEMNRQVGTMPFGPSHPYLGRASFSPNEEFVVIPTNRGVSIWSTVPCKKLAEWQRSDFHQLQGVTWSPDSSRFCVTYTTPAVGPTRKAWNIAYLLDKDCKEIAKLDGGAHTFSPSGDRIAAPVAGAGPVLIMDGRTGKSLTYLKGGRCLGTVVGTRCLQFSPDGNWLIHNDSCAVYRRTRSEWWYSILQVPAHWGLYVFLSLLIGKVGLGHRLFATTRGVVGKRFPGTVDRSVAQC